MAKKLIEWTDKLSIDNGLIDTQHQKLVELINDLYAAFLEGKANEHLTDIIEELAAYTVSHFKTEEVFFAKVSYPEIEEHKIEHTNFVNKVLEFKNKLASGEVSLSYDIMNFLRDWLKNHILVSDRKYISFLSPEMFIS